MRGGANGKSTVITFGVFDYLYLGHLRLFKKAKKLGDSLVVAVQEDEYVKKSKNITHVMYPLEVRMEMVNAFREVDYVISYQDVSKSIVKEYFDVFAIGEDQKHIGF